MRAVVGALALAAALGAGAGLQRWLNDGGGAFAAPEGGPYARPEFRLPDLDDGRERSIAEWDGQRIVLNFWASWCAPCLEEMPMFVRLQDRYGDQGVQFLGVAMDQPEPARQMAERLKLNYPSLVGELDAMQVASAFGNSQGVLPYTVLIDADGQVQATHAGLVDGADLERWLEED